VLCRFVLIVVFVWEWVFCVVGAVWWSESADVFISESSVRASVVTVCVREMSMSLPLSALNEVVSSMLVFFSVVVWVVLVCSGIRGVVVRFSVVVYS
jgi:hypothetical protein